MRALYLITLLVACSQPKTEPKVDKVEPKVALDATVAEPAAKPDPCSPEALNLPSAKRLASTDMGDKCDVSGTMIATTEAEAKGCAKNVDWKVNALLVTRRNLSPATVAIDALDDGKVVTFVGHQRPNCPSDPRPMPIQKDYAYLLPAGATRTFAEANCTLERTCP